jgi:hypothetical protein
MKLWILRYELAPATIAKIANRTTCGRRYSLPSARRGSSISANSVRKRGELHGNLGSSIRVACQRVRDFASQESSIALPGATLPPGNSDSPPQVHSVEQPCGWQPPNQ